MDSWTCQFYFVAAARKDGSAPSLEKVVESKIFLIEEEAKAFCELVSKRVGYTYRVFEGVATIKNHQP